MYKTVLSIDGMMCGMCEAHVNDAVRSALNVKKVTSSHKKGETVILSETEPDRDVLAAAIEKTGYRLTDYKCDTEEKKKFSLFKK